MTLEEIGVEIRRFPAFAGLTQAQRRRLHTSHGLTLNQLGTGCSRTWQSGRWQAILDQVDWSSR